MGTILDWLWNQVWPNIFASMIIGSVLWFWKLRTHFRKVHEIHTKLTDSEANKER